jgi:hypothetical protein
VTGKGRKNAVARKLLPVAILGSLVIAGCHQSSGDWNNQAVIDTNVAANESIANTLNTVEPPIVSNQGTVPPSNSSAPERP